MWWFSPLTCLLMSVPTTTAYCSSMRRQRWSCVCSRGRHTGLIRRWRLRRNWPGYTEMKSLKFGSLINSQDLHHLHFHAHRPSPCQWPISKSRFHNLLLQTYCLVSILVMPEGWRREDMFWQHCSKFYEFVTQFGRSSFLWVSWDLLEMYGSLPSPRLSSWVSFNYS